MDTSIRTKPEKGSYMDSIKRKIVGHKLDIEYHTLMLQKQEIQLKLDTKELKYVEMDTWSNDIMKLHMRECSELQGLIGVLEDAIRLSLDSIRLHRVEDIDSDDSLSGSSSDDDDDD